MKLYPIGSSISTRFYGPDDGGGDGSPAGGGADPAAGGNNPADGGSNGSGGPDVLDIDENRLIRIKGQDKPIKFGEYGRTFQSQFTKASQEAARLKKELDVERANRTRYENQQRQQQQQPQGGGKGDVYAALEQLPYLSGKDAVQVVQSITEQIGQRDQVLLATLKQLQQMKQVVDNLNGNYTNQSFDAKIAKFVESGGLPKELTNWAKELYLAYEGDDLDEQFPGIMKERYEELNKIIDATKQAKLRASRGQPFVPGKGGNTGPNKALELKPNASAKEVADLLWQQGGFGSDT